MTGYCANIEQLTLANNYFRKVLFTAPHSQLVLMALQPGEDIGAEVHPEHDQFFRFEQGSGEVHIDGDIHQIRDDFAVIVPAGANHNVKNTGDGVMKLYTIYSPAEHRDGTVHKTKAEALASHH